MERLAGSERFRGIDELLTWLDTLTAALRADEQLARLAFLGLRAIGDIETALEATLSGYAAVAFDAMRDMLEIDFQLRDFAVDPQRIETWLSADEKTLKKEFQPVHVRVRLQKAGAVGLGDNATSLDYKGHSQMLHLRPPGPHALDLLPGRGRSEDTVFTRDMGLWEIVEHGRSLRGAFQSLTSAVSPGTEADREARRPLPAFKEALTYVHFAQQHFMALSRAKESLKKGRTRQALNVIVSALVQARLLDAALLENGRLADVRSELTRLASTTDGMARSLSPIALALLEGFTEDSAS
ncbi:hypothetical protein [Streptomyces sp. st115]|uniref:hypothetical protein n=1 Tax=Streptomyces sp. st115 TaxID=1828047 RepID=UPI00117CEEB9|nr:hypothetical protein [Streptomyces sp. st115]